MELLKWDMSMFSPSTDACLKPPIEGFRDFATLNTCRSEAEIPQRGAYLPERRDLTTGKLDNLSILSFK